MKNKTQHANSKRMELNLLTVTKLFSFSNQSSVFFGDNFFQCSLGVYDVMHFTREDQVLRHAFVKARVLSHFRTWQNLNTGRKII